MLALSKVRACTAMVAALIALNCGAQMGSAKVSATQLEISRLEGKDLTVYYRVRNLSKDPNPGRTPLEVAALECGQAPPPLTWGVAEEMCVSEPFNVRLDYIDPDTRSRRIWEGQLRLQVFPIQRIGDSIDSKWTPLASLNLGFEGDLAISGFDDSGSIRQLGTVSYGGMLGDPIVLKRGQSSYLKLKGEWMLEFNVDFKRKAPVAKNP